MLDDFVATDGVIMLSDIPLSAIVEDILLIVKKCEEE
jgi:hypothetical protein